MAHAGTPTDLKRPAPSTTNGLRQPFIVAILILSLAAGIFAVTSNLARTSAPAANPNQIQSVPGAVDPHKIVGHKGAMIYQ